MHRIQLAIVLSVSLILAPFGVEAQQVEKAPSIVYLGYGAPGSDPSAIAGLRRGLRELGYVENQTIAIEYRYADNKADRLAQIIAELSNRKVDVLITQGTAVTAAAQRGAVRAPIVSVSGDPVGSGFAQTLARPGGNITGPSFAVGETFGGKWLELVHETVPKASSVAIMWNPANRSSEPALREMEVRARALSLRLAMHPVRSAEDVDAAFTALTRARAGALIILTDPLTVSQIPRIAKLAAASRVPTFFGLREFVDAGGLMSYGPSLSDLWRRAAIYVDKILKGAKPGDLPIEQPTQFELVINAKTAKALGLTIPQSILTRADQIIQ